MTAEGAPGVHVAPIRRSRRVAYVMSRFPKLTETFVVTEIEAVERQGVAVEIFPLLRQPDQFVHPGVAPLVSRAHYLPFLSLSILLSQVHFLRRRPRAYLGAIATIVQGAWGSWNYLLGGLAILPKAAHMARLMGSYSVDHVHCHFSNHPATAGLIIHRLTGLPFSFTAHGSDLHVDRHLLPVKARDALFVIAISEYNREMIVRECGPAVGPKVEVIHCGIDTDRFRPADAAVAEPGCLRLISVGTLNEVKGHGHLIRACARLAAAGVEIRCEIVGDGPDRAAHAALIEELGLSGRVRLAGAMTSDAVAQRLRDADVLVAPSVPTSDGRREGIPIVIMEAMASGLAVVASQLSGIPELVEDGRSGLLVPPGDEAAIAEAIERLARDPDLRRRLGSAGRERVEQAFHADRSAARLVELFDSAVAA
jgi:glycosyltransferase involved in cell wall biosynthesis